MSATTLPVVEAADLHSIALGLLKSIREQGGCVWVASDGPHFAIHHSGARKSDMRQLRELPADIVKAAIAEEARSVAGVHEWLLERTIPGYGFNGNLNHLYRDYLAWTSEQGIGAQPAAIFVSVLPYSVSGDFAEGIMLVADYKAAAEYEAERRQGQRKWRQATNQGTEDGRHWEVPGDYEEQERIAIQTEMIP